MVTVGDVFELAIEIDMTKIAHRTFWALSNGHVTTSCSSEKLKDLAYDEQAISQMVKANLLGIGKIQLFVIRTPYENVFAFYYAENALEAMRLHANLFKKREENITHADRLMTSMIVTDGKQDRNLYEKRKQIIEFPAYIGYARAGSQVVYENK